MANVIKTVDALKKASEILDLAARAEKDKGATAWTATLHVKVCGYIMRVLFAPKDPNAARLEQTSENYAAVFHAIYNQSAWRQKFEKAEIFEKSTVAKGKEYGTAELEEEMGE
jgi:hypothetical protein